MATKKKDGVSRDPLDGIDDDPPERSEPKAAAEPEPEDDSGPEYEPEEPQETRRERRINRYREAQDRAERAERERDEARQEAMTHRQRADQFAMRPVTQAMPQADQHETELNSLYEEQEGLTARWNAIPEEDRASKYAEYMQKARNIDERRHGIIARRELDRRGVAPSNPNEHIVARIRMEHPDVAGDERASRWCQAYVAQKAALGIPVSWELINEAMGETRKAFRMPGASPPQKRAPVTKDQQARYTSPSQSAGVGAAPKQVVTMNKHYRKMAEARYPNDAPKVAYQKWANAVGKKLIQE